MKLFFISLLLFISSVGTAQIKVTVFDDNKAKESDQTNTGSFIGYKNLLSLSPKVTRGVLGFLYERVLAPKHSVQATLGITYRDFLYEFLHDAQNSANYSHQLTDNVFLNAGIYYDFGYKFYPNGYYDFDGIYLQTQFISRNYHLYENIYYYKSNPNSAGYLQHTSIPTTTDASYSTKEVCLKFGYMYEAWFSNKLIGDVYFGLGYRIITQNLYQLTYSGIVKDYPTGVIPIQSKTYAPAIYLGTNIGLPF